ncbi:MAG: hypothetical protein K9K67_03710 [Bacteriovoracaceae bacterium]|nr:hypothetical protein [Bacteriovoracaceae bacterium]
MNKTLKNLFTYLIYGWFFLCGQSFAQGTLSVPTVAPSFNFNNIFINPALYQSTSFGGIDCQYYNAFTSGQHLAFGLPAPVQNCGSLSNNYPVGPVDSVFEGQLGENEELSAEDLLNYTNRREIRENIYDPYGEVSRFVNRTLSGPTRSSCPSDYIDEDAYPQVDLELTLSSEDRERLFQDLGDQPNWEPAARGRGRLTELPSTGNNIDDQVAAGYYRYNDGDQHVFATERVTWNIRAAGKILAEKNIVMGVGELSAQGGATPGHSEHQGGRDVDLRLIGPRTAGANNSARARPCTVNDSSCYDRNNTFEMIKAFVDVDPYGIDKIFINDPDLQELVNNYMSVTYGVNSFNGEAIARSCPGHSNHVHLSFKNNGTDPDEMARRAQ